MGNVLSGSDQSDQEGRPAKRDWEFHRVIKASVRIIPQHTGEVRPGWHDVTLEVNGRSYRAARLEAEGERRLCRSDLQFVCGGEAVTDEEHALDQRILRIRGDVSDAPTHRLSLSIADLITLNRFLRR